MLTRIKMYFQLLVNQSVSKTSETTDRMIFRETKILVHFYKTFQDILVIFHDFPWSWLFSMTFQAWKMVLLNSMTFQEEWSPWIDDDNDRKHLHHVTETSGQSHLRKGCIAAAHTRFNRICHVAPMCTAHVRVSILYNGPPISPSKLPLRIEIWTAI